METAQEHPEEVGTNRWWGEEGQATANQRGPPWERSKHTLRWETTGEHGGLEEMIFNTRGRNMLPTLLRETGSIMKSFKDRTGTSQGNFRPRGRREPTRNQLILANSNSNEVFFFCLSIVIPDRPLRGHLMFLANLLESKLKGTSGREDKDVFRDGEQRVWHHYLGPQSLPPTPIVLVTTRPCGPTIPPWPASSAAGFEGSFAERTPETDN